jgi:hypothetical protein
MQSFKKIVILLGLAATVFIGIAAETRPVTDKPRNLKVLPKNISDEALDKIMDSYKDGLGVKCDFCHSKAANKLDLDFAKDEKPEKEIARKMMRMTKDINKKYFRFNNDVKIDSIQAVTCITCHRKEPKPVIDTTHFIR